MFFHICGQHFRNFCKWKTAEHRSENKLQCMDLKRPASTFLDICVAEVYPWHASAQDDMMMPENFSDMSFHMNWIRFYMTQTNPLPFHSPALRYITLQVAKSSAILEGDIDPDDLWGKGESLTWLEEQKWHLYGFCDDWFWRVKFSEDRLNSRVFWRRMTFDLTNMEPGEVAKPWEVCRRIKNASLRKLKSQELEFAASTICLWNHGLWPSKLWKKSLKHLGNYETWAPCVMIELQDDISTKATSRSLHRNKNPRHRDLPQAQVMVMTCEGFSTYIHLTDNLATSGASSED